MVLIKYSGKYVKIYFDMKMKIFYEWRHRTGIFCPLSSLDPLGKGRGRSCQALKQINR